MNPIRTVLLAGSENAWLREQAVRQPFVRRAVSRFMPGESLDDALRAAEALGSERLSVILTNLGENVADRAEACGVTEHYLGAVDRLTGAGLDAEISVKLTQLGLDLGVTVARENLERIAERASALPGRLWVDMESSPYVERTLEVVHAVRARHPRIGVALQAYLHRSRGDLETLAQAGAGVRVVKGAYREPPSVAMTRKADVDESFFQLAARLLEPDVRARGAWLAAGTHDPRLIARIEQHVAQHGVPQDAFEFAMLFGIQRAEQRRLVQSGYRCRVLISYGAYWFPWYMRRLAERPANLLFAMRSMFQR